MKLATKRIICLVLTAAMLFCSAGGVRAAGEQPAVSVAAKSAILMEAGTGEVLFEKNADEFLNPASVTKIMTLLLVTEALESGKIAMDEMISTSETAAAMGGSQIWLEPGEQMSVHDLLKATCIVSANDAAYALAEHVAGSGDAFVKRMNERARELGCANTAFKNPTGLDTDGHGTTARDIAIMSRELIKHKAIREFSLTWMDSVRDGKNMLVNTNKLIKTYKGLTGLKTGSTGAALYCLSATAERDGMELISVVLASPTTKDRFADAAALLDYGYANFESLRPEVPPLGSVKVSRGLEAEIPLKLADEKFAALLPKGGEKKLHCEINRAEEVTAPVEAGQKIGTVSFILGEEKIGESDIVAADAVARMGFAHIFFLLLTKVMPSK